MTLGVEQFLLDPANVQMASEYALGVSQNCLVALIAELASRRDNARAEKISAFLADVDRSKRLTERIAQKITQAFRDLCISKEEFELLRPAVSDQVLSAELARGIASDAYSVENVARILFQFQDPALEPRILRLASIFIEGIQAAIAEDPELHRLKELDFQVRTTETLADMRSEIRGVAQAQSQDFAKVLQEVALMKQQLSAPVAEAYAGLEQLKTQNQKRFDRARTQLLTGSIVAAEEEYRALVADLDAQGSLTDLTLLFRSYTNLGSSLWQQFRRTEAVPWFVKAAKLKPDEPKAKTNLAICHLHDGKFKEALALLREVTVATPENFDVVHLVYAVYIEAGEAASALKTLQEKPFQTEEYFSALADAYIRNGDFKHAAEASRKALSLEDSADAKLNLANSLGFPVVNRRVAGGLDSQTITDAEYSELIEAIQLSESAISVLRLQERKHQLAEALTNLFAFYQLSGQTEKAHASILEASALAPTNHLTLTNLWSAQMAAGKYSDAYATATEVTKHGDPANGRIKKIEALLAGGDSDRAIRECKEAAEILPALRQDPRLFELRAQASFNSNDFDAAFEAIQEGLALFPNNQLLLTTRASFYHESGQPELARQDTLKAEEMPSTSFAIAARNAMYFYASGDWQGAIRRLEKLGADTPRSPLLVPYIICLHNIGAFQKSFELAMRGIDAAPAFEATLYDLAGRAAYNCDDLVHAEKLLSEVVKRSAVTVLQHSLMLAQVYLRLDQPDKALNILKKAQAKNPKDAGVFIGLTHIHTLKKEHREAAQSGYLAVKVAAKDVRAHLAFVKAALECPPDFKISPKHQKQFNASLEFLTKHPSGYLKAIPFDKDLKAFISIAKGRAQQAHEVEELMRQRNLPMAFLCHQLSVSAWRAWTALTGHTKIHIPMAYGTTEEQIREQEVAKHAQSICLDIFSLLTLSMLNCLHLLPRLFPKILVHTSTLESIVSEIQEIESSRGSATISYQDGKLVRTEVSKSALEEWGRRLRELREFVKGTEVERASLPANTPITDVSKTALEVLGTAHVQPLLLAQAREATFYSDDGPLRSLASGEYRVPAFCTQALLRVAMEKKLITRQQYEDCLISLFKHNYHFVSEDAETLTRLMVVEHFRITELARALIFRITDSHVSQDGSIRVLSGFMFELWRSDFSRSVQPREDWINLCVEALVRAGRAEQILSQFVVLLALQALPYPSLFAGLNHHIRRSPNMPPAERKIFDAAVENVIPLMENLSRQEYSWAPSVERGWQDLQRQRRMLGRNGWL